MRAREVLAKILQLEADLAEARSRYLRLAGWINTSSTPDCRWRWVKEFGGVSYALSEHDAFEMERRQYPQHSPKGT